MLDCCVGPERPAFPLRGAAGTFPIVELPRASLGTLDPDWEAPKAITSWRRGVPLELLRYAGVNRLKVDIDYRAENGRWGSRRVEPYSLRYTQERNLILFVVNDSGQLRSYRADRIADIRLQNHEVVAFPEADKAMALRASATDPAASPLASRVSPSGNDRPLIARRATARLL